ncbi:MAG TPA: hypothetical protein VKJ47_01940 [Candidatus Binatia bacterium]|nr:hypothetical protein [Candidatus Binatia bacterium]
MKDTFPAPQEPGRRPGAARFQLSYATAMEHLGLTPLAVLPSQFFSPPRYHHKGEIALMYAVLEDAVRCFTKQFVEKKVRTRHLAEEAEAWFRSDDERWPFSFVNICAALGLDAQYLRQGLAHWRQQHPPPPRRMRQQAVHRTPCLRPAA